MRLLELCRIGMLVASLASWSGAFAQVNNADSPIIFSEGNAINTASLGEDISIHNPIHVLGEGGSLVGSTNLTFRNPFVGSGNFILNINSSNSLTIGGSELNSAVFNNDLTIQSGDLTFAFATAILKGRFSLLGSSYMFGDIIFDSNYVKSTSGQTLRLGNGSLTFAGAGEDFSFDSNINAPNLKIYLTNTSEAQKFGGAISGNLYRLSREGTSVFNSQITGQLLAYGGTAVLQGSNGSITGSGILLRGGKVILDNTEVNNNARISGPVVLEGGELNLKGVDGGVTAQALAAPTFNGGLNKISVTAGAGANSSASIIFSGPLVHNLQSAATVDFQGLSPTSQIFFNGQNDGPIAPWATVNGIDFATYGPGGVQAMSAVGRPSQISEGSVSSYVLGSGPQTALTEDVQVTAVTMNVGTNLDLGGHRLTLNGWIQNGGPATITNGILSNRYPTMFHTYLTTNEDLTLRNATLFVDSVVKNGKGALILDQVTSSKKAQFYVNEGMLSLNLAAPISSIQGISTIVVGDSAGQADSAVLRLLAGDQFVRNGESGEYVGIEVMSDGLFETNGHHANLSFLKVNSGTVDLGGGDIALFALEASENTATGRIFNGTINIDPENDPGGGGGPGRLNVGFSAQGDSLIVDARIVSNESLRKTGLGTIVLNNANNLYGDGTIGLTLEQGTVALKNSGAAGSTSSQIVFDGGALRADSIGALVLQNAVTGGSVITSGSEMVFSGGYRQTVFQSTFANSNKLTVNGYSMGFQNGRGGHSGTGDLVLSGTASGTSNDEFYQSSGALILDSDKPLPEGMTLTFFGGSIEAAGRSRSIGNNLLISNDITFSGSHNLTFTAASGNRVDNISGPIRIYVNGTGVITINNLSGSSSNLALGSVGTLVLSGSPTGLRSISVNKGTLRVQNSGASAAVLGNVSVSNGAAIGGEGALQGVITVAAGGTIDPGSEADSTGTLSFRTGLSMSAGSTFCFDLGLEDSDFVEIAGGALSITGTGYITIDLRNAGDFVSGTYTLISWVSRVSPTASFSLGDRVAGYNYSLFVEDNFLKVTATAVPEPGSIALFFAGAGLLFLQRVHRRRRA